MTDYTPSETPLPEDINRSKENMILNLFNLLVSVALIIALIYGVFYATSLIIAENVTYHTEQKYFGSLFSNSKKSKSTKNSYLDKLANSLWDSTVELEEGEKPIIFTPQVFEHENANAFMTPGGNMFVTSTLLNQSKSENELAFVICHELGHFYHRHNLKRMLTGLLIGTFNILTGTVSTFDSNLSGMGLAHTLAANKFSQNQETEADEFAIDCLNNKYGHVGDYDQFFNKTAIEEGFFSKIYSETHPLTKDRLKHLVTIIGAKNYSKVGEITPLDNKEKSP